MTQLLTAAFLVAALLATYAPAQAHSAPSRCRVDIYDTGNGHTTTDVFVGHKADGDTLTASFVDMRTNKSTVIYRGWTHIGTDVSGVTVTDKAGRKVC